MLVDGYEFNAYKGAGFGVIGDVKPDKIELKPPQGVDWMKYLFNVGKLSPIPKDLKFGQIPEGVTRLGGTFVVEDDKIVYAWADDIPGDHPDVNEVLKAAGI